MPIKIESKIIGYEVVKKEEPAAARAAESANPPEANSAHRGAGPDGAGKVVHMHEKLERPELLEGTTYKIKTPLSDHALYVTINDIVLNPGTEHERRRPFEIFINSKNMDHFQWVVALTRVISAVFRKGGDVTFLVEELHSVFDPRGGYFKKGRYTPSLVAELGDVIERHLKKIGLIPAETLDEHRKRFIAEKRAQLEAHANGTECGDNGEAVFPPDAQVCVKCSAKAVVKLDGCLTCLDCGESKCT